MLKNVGAEYEHGGLSNRNDQLSLSCPKASTTQQRGKKEKISRGKKPELGVPLAITSPTGGAGKQTFEDRTAVKGILEEETAHCSARTEELSHQSGIAGKRPNCRTVRLPPSLHKRLQTEKTRLKRNQSREGGVNQLLHLG